MKFEKIQQIINSKDFGKPQIISIILTAESEKILKTKLETLLSFSDKVIFSNVEKEVNDEQTLPYLHGLLVREYSGGEILRITYAVISSQTKIKCSIFLTDGELRYNSETDKIVTFIQKPNYVGDEPRDL